MTALENLTDAELLARLQAPTPHPLLPWPLTPDGVNRIVARGGPAVADLVQSWEERERVIHLSGDADDADAYHYGFELPHWTDADAALKRVRAIYIAGGKRATKSELAAKRVVQCAMNIPSGNIWCLQGTLETSVSAQQRLIWKYLPPHIRALNGKRRLGHARVNFSFDGGFTEGNLSLPNRTIIYFLTYRMEVRDYQGWKIGAPLTPELEFRISREPWLHNIGAWADENMPLLWLKTILDRCTTNDAKLIWTFSTTDGTTEAVNHLCGTLRTLASRPAELLAQNRRHLPDCPPGHMPYLAEPVV